MPWGRDEHGRLDDLRQRVPTEEDEHHSVSIKETKVSIKETKESIKETK